MKTTIEIPDELLRRAKAHAAMQGIPLRELLIEGLQRAMQPEAPEPAGRRTLFPVILGTPRAERLTDEQVAQALETMAQEEIEHDASLV